MSFLNSCWYYCVEDAAFWYIVGYITSTAGYSDLSGISSKLKWVLKFLSRQVHHRLQLLLNTCLETSRPRL